MMKPEIPKTWLMPAIMTRVICHGTAGSYMPSENDLAH